MKKTLWKLGIAMTVVVAACGSDGDDGAAPSDSRVCAPGDQKSCACPGGITGAQVCRDDGSGWGECQGCESAAGSGGSAGGITGGTGGTTGGTGGATGGTGGAAGGTGGATGGTGGATGGTGGATGGAGGAAGGAGGSGTCTPTCGAFEECHQGSLCVAKMVNVAGEFEIDATEVTRSQYAAWLLTNPSTSGQPSYCSWNSSYTPACEWPAGTKGSHPVVCVDWCDAYEYCKAVGKRLCGQIGGGSNPFNDHRNADSSQWYKACSSDGQNRYPYGDTYSETRCNGDDAGHDTTVEVGSMSNCESPVPGYEGVYDLSGNVWEWEDSCNDSAGASDECHVRGGSFDNFDPQNLLSCGTIGITSYGVRDSNDSERFGFRCCSSP